MTYRQLAQLAGVSVSTVSKALSGSEEISTETAERILKLAIKNGIKRPRYYRSGHLGSIAILTPGLNDGFCSKAIDIVSQTLWENKIVPKVYICGEENSRYSNALDAVSVENCSGIISLYEKNKFSHPIDLPVLHIPYTKMLHGAFLADNSNCGIAQAVKHLVSLGHTEIGFVGGGESAQVQEGFKGILEAAGLSYSSSYVFRLVGEGQDVAAAARYFISGKMPSALITSSEETAISLLEEFEKNGVRVPEDLSIVGVGNGSCAECKHNRLSTVELISEETLVPLIRLFLRDIANQSEMPKAEYLVPQSKLIIRATTAQSKKAQSRKASGNSAGRETSLRPADFIKE